MTRGTLTRRVGELRRYRRRTFGSDRSRAPEGLNTSIVRLANVLERPGDARRRRRKAARLARRRNRR